jgi:hypothetical protein
VHADHPFSRPIAKTNFIAITAFTVHTASTLPGRTPLGQNRYPSKVTKAAQTERQLIEQQKMEMAAVGIWLARPSKNFLRMRIKRP